MTENRLLAAFKAFVDQLFPRLSYMGGYQYTVTSCDYASQTFDGEPVNQDLGLPPLVRCPIRSPLLMVKLTRGEVVVVSFENYDPAYPYVSGLPSAGASGLPVVRQGDVCWVQASVVPLASMFTPLPGGVPPLPNVMGIVVDPTKLGPPPVPPVPPAVGSAKIYGIASTGSTHVKSK